MITSNMRPLKYSGVLPEKVGWRISHRQLRCCSWCPHRIVLLVIAIAVISNCCGCHGGTTQANAKKTIAIVTPANGNWFNAELIEGARDKAAVLGWNPVLQYSPSGDADDAALVKLALQAIAAKPDAISVCGMAAPSLSQVVRQANLAGVPIFVHNQISPVPGIVQAYIGYDEYDAGRKCAEYALELLVPWNEKPGTTKQIAIVSGSRDEHSDLRVNGFKDVVKFKDRIQVVAEMGANWSQADADKLVSKWLVQYPKLDLIYACSDKMARGASHAVYEAKASAKCMGIGGSPDGLYDVKADNLVATLATDPKRMGARIITVMMDHFSNSGLISAGTVVKTDITLVHKGNIGDFVGGFAEPSPTNTQGGAGDKPHQ